MELSSCAGEEDAVGATEGRAQAVGAKLVHHPGGQRAFRADHSQTDLVFLRPGTQGMDIGDGQAFQAAIARRTAVARGNKHHLHFG